MKTQTQKIVILSAAFILLSGCTIPNPLAKNNNEELSDSKVKPGEAGVLDIVTQPTAEENINEEKNNQENMQERIATEATFKTTEGDFVIKFY